MDKARRYRRAAVAGLLSAALLLVALGLAAPSRDWRPWTPLLAAEEDGAWLALRIDRWALSGGEYRISIRDGDIAGGRDGCNDWAYGRPDAAGRPTIETTLVGCPEDDPLRRAHWRLAHAGRPGLLPDGRLRVVAPGHEGLFRRCKWETRRHLSERSSSVTRVCVPLTPQNPLGAELRRG